MACAVREMELSEVELIVDYFHRATPEHLKLLGIDASRLPPREAWSEYFKREYALVVESRTSLFLIWLADDLPVGFSSCDKIAYGDHAYMHLHVHATGYRDGMRSQQHRHLFSPG